MPKGGRRVGAGQRRGPVEKKILEGRFRKHRDPVPLPVTGPFPDPPDHVSEAERAAWAAWPHQSWIVEGDKVAVDAGVSLYARVIANRYKQRALEAEADWRDLTPDGKLDRIDKEMKLVNQEIALWGRLLAVLGTLGLTPADRTRLTPKPTADATTKDKWAGVL